MKTRWKSRQRFGNRLTGIALAFVMTAACIIAALGGTAHAAEPLDLARKCVLQVKVEPKAMEEGGEAEAPEVAIDLYKVADAVKLEDYDAYRFETKDSFAGLDVDIAVGEADAAQAWMGQARQAASIVFAEGNSMEPSATAVKADEASEVGFADLEPGLYLMVPRGADLEQEDYLFRDTDGEDGTETIQTVAYSDSYTFTYSPQLVALPMRKGVEGSAATSDLGEWIYELTGTDAAESKPALSGRFADLRIDKELLSFRTGSPATFVFTVEAVLHDNIVYSNAVSMTFDGPGIQSELIADRIPVGAQVTVTEVYSGAAYQVAAGSTQVQTVTMANADAGSVDFANIASFQNVYDGSGREGAAITNHFEYMDDGEGLIWNWTQDPGRTPGVAD